MSPNAAGTNCDRRVRRFKQKKAGILVYILVEMSWLVGLLLLLLLVVVVVVVT